MIDILMATYNGELYLREQLDSIIRQSYTDWRLIIADDCSKDRTVNILKEYQCRYPSKISYYINDYPSGSAKNNFYKLLTHIENDYFMLSDQDDVWLEDKIFVSLKKIKSMENIYGNNIPLLVHTDLNVVDKKLNNINSSLFHMQKMNPERDNLNDLLVSNIVTGCTVIGNNVLASLIVNKIPNVSIMHDMWLALISTIFGKIGFIDKPTVLYRQHGKNTEGAKDIGGFDYVFSKFMNLNNVHKNLFNHYEQAGEILRLFSSYLKDEDKILLYEYSNLNNKSIYEKYRILKKYKLFKPSYIQRLGQLFI